jgi:multimeric flavodoxin WrbA
MENIAVVYYSGYGHTKMIAEHIKIGADQPQRVSADLLSVDEISDVDSLNKYGAIVFGAPTYMGSVPYQFKKFMDSSSKIWLKQGWKNKIAAGFTNSGSINGDKFNVLMQFCTFACQQGMLWLSLGVSNNSIPHNYETGSPKSLNRMGSSLGLMTQSDNAIPELTPPSGDKLTAEIFGQRIADFVLKLK